MKSGFCLVLRSSKGPKQLSKQKLRAYMTMQCQHGIQFQGKEKHHLQVFKTKYSRKCDTLCQCRINISLCEVTDQWKIHNSKASKRSIQSYHTGHFKMLPAHIHTNISLLPEKEIEIAKQCSQLNLTSTTMASLISIQNALGIDNTWNRHQIFYKSRQLKEVNAPTSNDTSASKLIALFENRKDTNYLYVTFKPEEGLMMMTGT